MRSEFSDCLFICWWRRWSWWCGVCWVLDGYRCPPLHCLQSNMSRHLGRSSLLPPPSSLLSLFHQIFINNVNNIIIILSKVTIFLVA